MRCGPTSGTVPQWRRSRLGDHRHADRAVGRAGHVYVALSIWNRIGAQTRSVLNSARHALLKSAKRSIDRFVAISRRSMNDVGRGQDRELSLLLVTLDHPGVMTPLAKIAIFGHPPLRILHPPHHLSTASLRAGRKSVRIASLSFAFYFAIFLDSTKRIFPDSGVP
jgi:hypothetical protein